MHKFEPRDGFIVATAGESKHKVGFVHVLSQPLSRAFVAINGMAEDAQPVVVVLYKPLLRFNVVLEEVGEGCQLGMAGIDKPLEEFFASADGLLEGEEYTHIILYEPFGQVVKSVLGTDFCSELGFEVLL